MTKPVVDSIVETLSREHVEYVIGEAETHRTVDAFDAEAIADAKHDLHAAGFETDDDAPLCFAAPDVCRLGGLVEGHDGVFVYDVEVHEDTSIPDGRAIVIHPKAVVAPPRPSTTRPWLVRYPRGVVVLTVEVPKDD